MSIFYRTKSGSLYQVDETQKSVRRVEGAKPPSNRQGPDGEWRKYQDYGTVNGQLVFDWDGKGQMTITSKIVSMNKSENA